MPLPLLNSHLDLATLNSMDDIPGIAAEWLLEKRVEPADVLLCFCQGFDRRVPAEPKTLGVDGEHISEWVALGDIWHLPQPTLATWAEHVYGADRRQAVEEFMVREYNDGGLAFWYVWPPPKNLEDLRSSSRHLTTGRADRELRLRVARLFPEVKRWVYEPDRSTDILQLTAEQFVPPEPVDPMMWQHITGADDFAENFERLRADLIRSMGTPRHLVTGAP